MLKKFFQLSLVLLLVVVSLTLAQRQTGSVVGKVTDTENTPLPGASVTLQGPALMGTLTYVTTESGDFRFPAIPPGKDYVITASLDGFNTVSREGIIVNVGKTVTVGIQLEPATLAEELTVTAPSPTVDVTSSKLSVSYSEDLIRNLPFARDYSEIIFSAPGVIEEGTTSIFRTFVSQGATVRSNQIAVDGVSISDPTMRNSIIGISYDVFEEVEMELGAHSAEVGKTEGAYVNIVTKSGGNEFHGQLSAYYFSRSMIKDLVPESEAQAVGLSKPTGFKKLADFSLSLGGPIIKDKLWFFVNGRYIDWTKDWETIINGLFDVPHDEINTFIKLSFQINPNLKLTGLWSFTRAEEPLHSYYLSGEMGYYQDKSAIWTVPGDTSNIVSGQLSWILDQNTFFDLRFNYAKNIWRWVTQNQYSPYITDLFTGIVSGSMLFSVDIATPRTSLSLSGTRFLDNFLGANHEIKAGIMYELSATDSVQWKDNPYMEFTYNDSPWALENVAPFMGMFMALAVGANEGDTVARDRVRRFGVYFQDSITVKDRLTLNLGLRYDEEHGDILGGTLKPVGANDPLLTMLAPQWFTTFTMDDKKDLFVWKFLSPRVGVVFDIFGDGKTSLKASWSLYNEFLMGQDLTSLNPAYYAAVSVLWFDLNMNGIIEVADLCVPTYIPPTPDQYNYDDFVDADLETPYSTEFIVGIDREVLKDISFGISYIYKKKNRLVEDIEKLRGNTTDSGWWIPYTAKDPGWDGQFGTDDDSDITVYGLKAGAPSSQLWITNPERAKRTYHGVQFLLTKRMSNRWQLIGSLTLSKYEGNIGAGYDATWHMDTTFNTPNSFVNSYGRIDFDRPVLIKLQGTAILPLDFTISAYYSHASGAPWARTVAVQLPYDPSLDISSFGQYVTVNAETPGSRRFRSRNNLDVRAEKNFRIGSFGQLGIFLDVINVFGERFFEIDQDPGGYILNDGFFQQWPSYGRFISAIGQRTFKVSARFTF
jgi:hypothetical protein